MCIKNFASIGDKCIDSIKNTSSRLNLDFTMEGSTGELLVDAEDLMLDTKIRLESCSDAYTSFEIVEEDLIFTKKN